MPAETGPARISRYEVQGLIARGGMGRIYLARDPNADRLVAIKLLDATLDSTEVRDRFDREARSLAALNHPSIVRIYDYGEFQESPFIVMEYVRGETVQEKISRRAPMAVGDALRLMAELCAGLAHAHAAGIIHRDIKPANLVVDQDERLKILDFGIARVADSNLTRVQAARGGGAMQIGTPGYMSPEATRGESIDHRTDVFAVGAVCYELLASRRAFPGRTVEEIERAVMRTPPGPLAAELQDLPPGIDHVLARAMARDPADRFPDAIALQQAFEECRLRPGIAAAASPPPTARPAPVPSAFTGAAHAPAPRRPAMDRPRRDPETISVDPTVLIDRADRTGTPEPIEPTVAIDREELARRMGRAEPPPPRNPSRPRQGAASAPEPTVLVQQPRPASAPPRARARGAAPLPLWLRVKAFFGGGPAAAPARPRPPAPPASGRRQAGGGLSPTARGAALAIAAIAGAALLLFGAVQAWQWMRPAGEQLTLSAPEGGTIVGSGIICGTRGATCSASFPTDEPVELRAEADAGFVFTEFTGDCPDTGRLIMSGAKSCGATFRRVGLENGAGSASGVRWPLTITKPTGGSLIVIEHDIACGSLGDQCAANVPDGQPVTLVPQTDKDHRFVNYTGDCAPHGETVMSGARTCGATFARADTSQPIVDNVPTPSRPVPSRRPPSPGGTTSAAPAAPPTPQPAPPAQPSAPGTTPGSTAGLAPSTPQTAPGPPPAPARPSDKEPAPPISPEAHAQKEITQLVNSYCAALQSMDAATVRKFFPLANERSLREQFRQYKSLKCAVTEPKFLLLQASGTDGAGSAQVKFDMKQTIEMRSGGAPKEQETIVTLRTSRKTNLTPWLIDGVEHEPKPK